MGQKRRKRRHWEEGEKRRIVAQTRVPGVSVSQVARRYDVNANLVFKWLRDPQFNAGSEDAVSFLPVSIIEDAPFPIEEEGRQDRKIEIALASGHRVSVSGLYDPEALGRLIRSLPE